MKKFFLSLALLSSSSLFAVLSPLDESIVEIQAVLNNTKMKSLKTSESIQEIIRSEKGFLVITDNYQMQVDINYQPVTRPGPQTFELNFHAAVPLQGQGSSEEQ